MVMGGAISRALLRTLALRQGLPLQDLTLSRSEFEAWYWWTGVQARRCYRSYQARHSAHPRGHGAEVRSPFFVVEHFTFDLIVDDEMIDCDASPCASELTRRFSPLVVMASAVSRARLRTLAPRQGLLFQDQSSCCATQQVVPLLVPSCRRAREEKQAPARVMMTRAMVMEWLGGRGVGPN